MNTPMPFLLGKSAVTASEAADLVTHQGKNCHDFGVNPLHQSASVSDIAQIVTELGLAPEDGDAYLMQQCLMEAIASAVKGRYGVGAILASTRTGVMEMIETAQNEREKGQPFQYLGHAETQLVLKSTEYLQRDIDHSKDIAAVNLCPCPGCFGLMVDAHYPTVLVGSVDPMVGAAFLKGEPLRYALGDARRQVMDDKKLLYRFPEIKDADLRDILLTASWDIFHATRSKVHKKVHDGELQE